MSVDKHSVEKDWKVLVTVLQAEKIEQIFSLFSGPGEKKQACSLPLTAVDATFISSSFSPSVPFPFLAILQVVFEVDHCTLCRGCFALASFLLQARLLAVTRSSHLPHPNSHTLQWPWGITSLQGSPWRLPSREANERQWNELLTSQFF